MFNDVSWKLEKKRCTVIQKYKINSLTKIRIRIIQFWKSIHPMRSGKTLSKLKILSLGTKSFRSYSFWKKSPLLIGFKSILRYNQHLLGFQTVAVATDITLCALGSHLPNCITSQQTSTHSECHSQFVVFPILKKPTFNLQQVMPNKTAHLGTPAACIDLVQVP